ncbi:hypothetical protein WN51_06906 [Melipona quadrifasciata]|uniref:Uncharacterized protein n=1 Tax=Melipona quadrifasciata TaxID=166423 RepID=A0A0M8ZNG1_9HYME|nr:hypothetical protein WN51_06906 [Melipona quadrifasciata]
MANSRLARPTRALLLLALTSLALPDDSVSLRTESLPLSRFSLDLKPPVVLEPEELAADSHGFVRIRERSRGDWTVGDSKGGGMEEGGGGAVRLLLEDSAEKEPIRLSFKSTVRCVEGSSSGRQSPPICLAKRIASLCDTHTDITTTINQMLISFLRYTTNGKVGKLSKSFEKCLQLLTLPIPSRCNWKKEKIGFEWLVRVSQDVHDIACSPYEEGRVFYALFGKEEAEKNGKKDYGPGASRSFCRLLGRKHCSRRCSPNRQKDSFFNENLTT